MSSSFEKSVKGGTKVKLAPPKSKYVEHILLATQSGEAGVAEVFRTLTLRLRDSTWTVAFKSLIIVHLMVKEGAEDVTLSYLSAAPSHRLAVNQFTDVQTQGQNIRRYSEYLLARAKAFASARCDYVRSGLGHMKRLSVDKGLLRETEIVQDQVKALVKCNLLDNDVENEITLTAFRLLTRDLLDLFNVENEAVMQVLSRFFEMSKPDAERSVRIYKQFCKQTDQVVQFLSVARQFEHATRLEVPKIKHAPTGLAASLQDYLDDKDFDTNRRQYMAEQDAKKDGKPFSKPSAKQSVPQPSSSSSAAVARSKDVMTNAGSTATTAGAAFAPPNQQPKGPAPDLIDFFESIEQNQQPLANDASQFQQPQQTGFASQQQAFAQAPQPFGQQSINPFGQPQMQPQQTAGGFMQDGQGTNPFGQQPPQVQQQTQPLQTQFTGAGFGGYGPQPQQQQPFETGNAFGPSQQQPFPNPTPQAPAQQLQPQSTNPFRQSMMPTGAPFQQPQTTGMPPPQRQTTNPFAKSSAAPQIPSIPEDNAFQQLPQQQSAFSPLQPQPTGTNPFARAPPPQQQQPTAATLQVQPTGSTNPFRQSAFVNQATGGGWQNAPQATMGGLEQLETVPVFPRPGAPQQQQTQQTGYQQQMQTGASPWG